MAKLLAVFCAALFSCLAIAPASARAVTPGQPTPPQFTVRLVAAHGSGCPVGSTAVSAPSATTFVVAYDQYVADAGDGAKPNDFRKNCLLDVVVGVPAGWSFGIAGVQYRGFAALGTGAQGTLEASYYFGGLPAPYLQPHSLLGPMNNDFEFDDQQPLPEYAPCHYNGTLHIDSSLNVSQGTDPSFFNELAMDSSEPEVVTIFHLAFQQC